MGQARSCNHRCSGKAISITYYEPVFVALGILHAMRKHHITLSSVACLAVSYFFTLSHKRRHVLKKFIEHKMCVVIFFIVFVCSISHSEKNRGR
jgi:uncharacterized membrane protein YhaH (DUF805 family)